MKTFKSYLREEDEEEVDKPAGTESLSTMLFDLHSKDIKTLKIPIHSAILKRVIPSTVRATVFHVKEHMVCFVVLQEMVDMLWNSKQIFF